MFHDSQFREYRGQGYSAKKGPGYIWNLSESVLPIYAWWLSCIFELGLQRSVLLQVILIAAVIYTDLQSSLQISSHY